MNLIQSLLIQKQIYGSLLDARIFKYYINWLAYRIKSTGFSREESEYVVLTNLFFTGNSRALMEYAMERGDDRFIWASRDYLTLERLRSRGYPTTMINWPSSLEIYRKTGIWIASHLGFPNQPPFLPKFYKLILLWHGAGPKPGSSRAMYSVSDYVVLPSEYVKRRHIELLGVPEEKCLATGYPRLDRLMRLSRTVGKEELGFSDGPIVLLAPTFDFWPRYWPPLEEILEWAEREGVNVILRTHPYTRFSMDLRWLRKVEERHGNFRFMDMFVEPDTEFLLAATDVLVTDWSSIFTDFLVLDRPIIFLKTPAPARPSGSVSELEPGTWPGPRVDAWDLTERIGGALGGDDEYRTERKRVLRLVHGEPDGRASERLYEFVTNLLESCSP